MILTLTLCLSAMSGVFAEGEGTSAGISGNTQTLYHLGLMELWQDSYVVTRGDAARVFARMVYPENLPKTGDSGYFDVAGNMAASDAVRILADMGYIAEDRYYNPLLPATGRDIAGLFAGGIMGYGKSGEDSWQTAVRLGLTQGIGPEEEVTAAGLSGIICRGLETPWLVRGGGEDLIKDEGQTLLSAMKLKKSAGVLTASPDGGIGGAPRTDGQAVFLENGVRTVLRLEDELQVYGFLGGRATYYYSYGAAGDTLVYADFSGVERVMVRGEDITAVTNTSITYEDEKGRERSVRLDAAGAVVYNGTPVPGPEWFPYLQPGVGHVALVRNGSACITAYVEDFEVGLIEQISYSDEKLTLRATVYGPGQSINLRDYEEAALYKNGKAAVDLGDLTVQDVVWIARGLDREKITVYASSQNAVWGRIETRREDRIRIGGKDYALTEGTLDFSDYGQLEAGDTATFYFGPDGRIFAYTPDKIVEESMYGYLLQSAVDQSGFSDRITFRLINELGQKKELETAERVSFYDGTEGGNTRTVPRGELLRCGALFQGGKLVDQLVKYGVNGRGEICRILLPQDITDPGHTRYEEGYVPGVFSRVLANSAAEGFYMRYDNHGTGKFENKYTALPSAKVFYMDAGLELEEAEVTSVSAAFGHLWSNSRTNGMEVTLYNADQYLQVPMIVCKYQERTVSSRTDSMVVESVMQTMDADGNRAYALSGYQGGSHVERLVDEKVDVTGLKKGDVIQAAADKDGILVKYRMLCSIDAPENFVTSVSANGTEVTGSGVSWDTDLLVYRGAVYDKNPAGDRIVVHTGLNWDCFRSFALSGVMVVRFDRSRNQLTLDTVNSLAPSRSTPLQAVMVARQSVGKVLLILE